MQTPFSSFEVFLNNAPNLLLINLMYLDLTAADGFLTSGKSHVSRLVCHEEELNQSMNQSNEGTDQSLLSIPYHGSPRFVGQTLQAFTI